MIELALNPSDVVAISQSPPIHRMCHNHSLSLAVLVVRTHLPADCYFKIEANDTCVAISGTDEDGDDFRRVYHVDHRIYDATSVTAEMENDHWLRLTIPKHDD